MTAGGDAGGVPELSAEAALERASRADADLQWLAAVAGDEASMKRCPALATAIFTNPRASMAIAGLALRTCARIGVTPPDLEDFDALVRDSVAADGPPTGASAGPAEPPADDPAPSADDLLEEALAERVEAASPAPEAAPAPSQKPPARRSATIDFTKLKLFEKVRLATLGNANCRATLLRDPNRMVALAAIRSPRITDGDIVKAAGNRSLSEDVIRYIANRKELVKLYGVRLALVGNPKCGLALALRFLPTLNLDDIKQLARSKNVPGALAVAAKKLAAARSAQ